MSEVFLEYLEKNSPYPLNAAVKERLQHILTYRKFSQGEILVQKGTYNDKLYYILKGMVRSFYHDETGREITEWFLKEGDLIAMGDSYYDKIPCKESVEAIEDCQTLMLNFDDVEKMCFEFPMLLVIYLKITRSYSFFWRDHIKDLQTYSASKRYKALLQKYPEIVQRAPLKYIASYLNTTPEHLSRIRAKI